MVRVCSRHVPSRAFVQMGLESTLLFSIIVLGGIWQESSAGIGPLLYPALIFSVCMTTIISILGMYRRDQPRTYASVAARILFAFCIGFPLLLTGCQWFQMTATFVDSLAINNVLALACILTLRAVFIYSPLADSLALISGSRA